MDNHISLILFILLTLFIREQSLQDLSLIYVFTFNWWNNYRNFISTFICLPLTCK